MGIVRRDHLPAGRRRRARRALRLHHLRRGLAHPHAQGRQEGEVRLLLPGGRDAQRPRCHDRLRPSPRHRGQVRRRLLLRCFTHVTQARSRLIVSERARRRRRVRHAATREFLRSTSICKIRKRKPILSKKKKKPLFLKKKKKKKKKK